MQYKRRQRRSIQLLQCTCRWLRNRAKWRMPLTLPSQPRRQNRLLFLVDQAPLASVRRLVLILLPLNALLIGVTYLEGSWIIEGAGIGLFEDGVQAANIGGQLFAIWAASRLLQRIRSLHEPIKAAVHSVATADNQIEEVLRRVDERLAPANDFIDIETPTARRMAMVVVTAMIALVFFFQVYLPWQDTSATTTWVLSPRQFPVSWACGILWNVWTFGVVAASALWVVGSSALGVFSAVRGLIADGVLRIVPLAPDGRGGVAFLGDLSLAQSLVLGSGVPWLVMWVLLFGLDNRALLVGAPIYLSVLTVLFFLPLSGISRAMRDAKQRDLERFSRLFNLAYLDLESPNERGADKQEPQLPSHSRVQDVAQLHSLYRMAQDMPVWPFDVQTLRRFASLVGIPLIAILQQFVSDLPWKNLFPR